MMPHVLRDGETVVIRIPLELKRRGGRKEILVPEGLEGARPTESPAQEPLLTAVARAFHWYELLEAGRYASVTELAEALGLDRSYVGRILRLTLLAPDIVEGIAQGQEPSGLSLEQLTKRMPVAWEEQREQLGYFRRAETRPKLRSGFAALRLFDGSRQAHDYNPPL